MGNRTMVTLTVPKQFTDVIHDISGFEEDFEGSGIHYFIFYEVNYGELDFLDELIEQGIAFDSSWESVEVYSAGTKSCRFTPEGEPVIKEIYDQDLNPDIDQLIALIPTPNELIHFILDHKSKNSVLPWDNQVEYGKHYLARKLIDPTL